MARVTTVHRKPVTTVSPAAAHAAATASEAAQPAPRKETPLGPRTQLPIPAGPTLKGSVAGLGVQLLRTGGALPAKAPTPEALTQKLQEALAPHLVQVSKAFWGKAGAPSETRAVKLDVMCTAEELAESDLRPVTLAADPRSGITFAVFKQDVYVTSYFFNKRVAPHVPRPLPSLEDISARQPWFRFDAAKGAFEFKKDGVQAQLVEKLMGPKGDLVLYKGTSQEKLHGLDRLRSLPADTDVEVLDRLAWKFLNPAESFGAYFFAHEKKAVDAWVEDALVTVTIPRAEALDLASRGALYAGVEGGYVELALFEAASLKRVADRLQVETVPPAAG
jgi:hypothetical protein